MSNVNSLSWQHRGSRAVSDSPVLRNRSSSAESAHANAEASFSGLRLDSDGKSLEIRKK